MAIIQVEAYVSYVKYSWEDEARITIDSCDMSQHNLDLIVLRKQTFPVEIPDNFDPRPLQIAALRERQRKVMADAVATQTEIEEQIQRLLCIEAPRDDSEVIL